MKVASVTTVRISPTKLPGAARRVVDKMSTLSDKKRAVLSALIESGLEFYKLTLMRPPCWRVSFVELKERRDRHAESRQNQGGSSICRRLRREISTYRPVLLLCRLKQTLVSSSVLEVMD